MLVGEVGVREVIALSVQHAYQPAYLLVHPTTDSLSRADLVYSTILPDQPLH